ncbi:MAG TPA: hypothetical protein VFZ53_14095 [Polyangiaceae bacterium]
MARLQLAALTVVAGLASGTVGAIAYARFATPAALPPAPVAAKPPLRPPVIPPGWDVALVSRLNQVEQRLDELGETNAKPSASHEMPEDSLSADEASREQERVAAYRAELDFLDEVLANHAQEPFDASWARAQAATMEQSLSAAFKDVARPKSIDCRSETCTATLSFPTAGDALVSVQQQYAKLTVPGCRGLIAIPKPPVAVGSYDLTVVYNNCR